MKRNTGRQPGKEGHRDSLRKEQSCSLSAHPTPRKFFPRLGGFCRRWRLATMAEREGVAQREGVDLSCQTLAPRGGAPSLPPRLPARAPRCPIEITGFGVVSLRSLHPFFVSLPSRSLAHHFTCLGPSPSSPRSAPPCPPVPTNRRQRDYASPSHVFAPSGVALKTQFRNLHICCPGARASRALTF